MDLKHLYIIMALINKCEKRRGRPPKHLVISTPTKNKIKSSKLQEEQLVLYLPTFDNDTSISEKKNYLKKNKENTDNIFTSTDYNSDSDNKSSNKLKYLTDRSESNEYNVDTLLDEIQKRDSIINTLKMRLKEKTVFNDNTLSITKENKKQLINLGLININKNKLNICQKTDIACWWCTYQFDTQPLFMPDYYKNKIYYVFGNFCSFGCMLAYNEDMDDYKKNVRSSLIKQMYREIFSCDDMIIKPSGPREILEKFGGPINILKYRNSNLILNKTIKISIPPQIPLISDYEEIIIEK